MTYITLKGDKRVDIEGRRIEWTDRWGHHCGVVKSFGKTCDGSGSPVSHQCEAYRVECDDGDTREIFSGEMRDIIADAIAKEA